MQIFFVINFFLSLKTGEKVDRNPWASTTLEWTNAPSPPVGHGNFDREPQVFRPAYEYSAPGSDGDFTPQSQPQEA